MLSLLREYNAALHAHSVWRALAVLDMRMRFRRSYFGVAWMVFNQLIFALGAGYLWASILNVPPENFIPTLAIGLACWGFISGLLLEGCATFPTAAGYLRQLPLPRMVFIFRVVMVQATFLGIGLVTSVAVMAAFGVQPGLGVLAALPGLIMVLALGVLVVTSISFLGSRYRDLQHGLAMLLQLLFVVTPILYPPSVLVERGLEWAVHVNPLTAVIEVVRYPLLHDDFAPALHYQIVGGLLVLNALIAWLAVRLLGKRMIFWL